jgi:hypothetical protein
MVQIDSKLVPLTKDQIPSRQAGNFNIKFETEVQEKECLNYNVQYQIMQYLNP